MKFQFSQRMQALKASEIREILKVTQQPDIISFAGGLPAPELFPIDELKTAAACVLDEAGSQALQYSTTEGFEPLRRQIAERTNRKFQTKLTTDNILITSGSQQVLDFSGKLFLDKDDVVLCESPTYLAALSAFKAYEPQLRGVPTDDDGMIPEELERILQTTPNCKFMYVIPDFQNPTGRTWSLARRQKLVELANTYHVPIIEDNPYGELRFDGEMLPAIKAFDTEGMVIMVGTFSKTFCPGMRIGWLAADPQLIEQYVLIKQGADLHTSSISQQEIAKYMELYDFEAHINTIIAVYKQRRDAMMNAMQTYLPAGLRYTHPQGGLFTWVELPPHINTVDLLTECLKNKVAFVPGASFFPDGQGHNTLRLNFSNMSEERITEGIQRLSSILASVYQLKRD